MAEATRGGGRAGGGATGRLAHSYISRKVLRLAPSPGSLVGQRKEHPQPDRHERGYRDESEQDPDEDQGTYARPVAGRAVRTARGPDAGAQKEHQVRQEYGPPE